MHLQIYKPRILILDLSGLTEIKIDHKEIINFVLNNSYKFMNENWNKIKEMIKVLKAEAKVKDESKSQMIVSLFTYIEKEIHKPTFSPGVQLFLQEIIKFGIESKLLPKIAVSKGVQASLEGWTKQNIKLYGLTKYNAAIIRLLLSHTSQGNLALMFESFFNEINSSILSTLTSARASIRPEQVLLLTSTKDSGSSGSKMGFEVILIEHERDAKFLCAKLIELKLETVGKKPSILIGIIKKMNKEKKAKDAKK